MGLNIFQHDVENLLFVDIEGDNLSATYDINCRVYMVGVMDYQGVWCTYSSVEAFINSYHGPGNSWTYVFHNASFDVPALRLRGAHITNYFCTMVASHTLTPGSADEHSLGALVPAVKKSLRELLTEEGYDMKKVPKGQEYTWYGTLGDKRIDDLVVGYLGRDLLATRELYVRLEAAYSTVRPATLTLLSEVNIPYIERIIEFEQGCHVRYDESAANVLSEAADMAYNACLGIAGWKHTGDRFAGRRKDVVWGDQCLIEPFNPNSHQQVGDALTRLYGWEPMKRTVSGAISTSAEVLETLDYPLVEHLLTYSKSTKLLSFTGAIKSAHESGGIIRPSYNQCATRTTRLSSSGPNIQQIPSRDPVGKQLRKLFVAPEGYKLVVGDQGGLTLAQSNRNV